MIDAHREELHNRALSLSTSSKAGVGDYLACYQRALKSLLDSLSEEDKSKYRAQAKKLTDANLLPRQQMQYVLAYYLPRQVTKYGKQRMMERYGPRAFREFARYAYQQFGARVAIFAGYRDPEGQAAVALCVPSLYTYLWIY